MDKEKIIKLAELWDRLSEIAGGDLWNRLSKEEWKLARDLFDLEHLSSYQQSLIKQIEGMKKVQDITKNGGAKSNWRNTAGYNEGIEVAKSLIQTPSLGEKE